MTFTHDLQHGLVDEKYARSSKAKVYKRDYQRDGIRKLAYNFCQTPEALKILEERGVIDPLGDTEKNWIDEYPDHSWSFTSATGVMPESMALHAAQNGFKFMMNLSSFVSSGHVSALCAAIHSGHWKFDAEKKRKLIEYAAENNHKDALEYLLFQADTKDAFFSHLAMRNLIKHNWVDLLDRLCLEDRVPVGVLNVALYMLFQRLAGSSFPRSITIRSPTNRIVIVLCEHIARLTKEEEEEGKGKCEE